MAISDAYATYADYLMRFSDKPGRDQTKVARALEDCSRWIESRTHQFFTKNASPVARIWYGDGTNVLKVYGRDNCPGVADVSGMTVKLDTAFDGTFATTYTSNMYILEPAEALVGTEPSPYKELVLPFWTTAYFRFWPKPIRNAYGVQITAIYGWPSVPSTIRSGCVELVGILMGDSPLATRQFTDMGTVGASTEARGIVRDMIDVYREAVFA